MALQWRFDWSSYRLRVSSSTTTPLSLLPSRELNSLAASERNRLPGSVPHACIAGIDVHGPAVIPVVFYNPENDLITL